jgi:D-glycero-alpha-D-manno-heptose-7-phosphate kinase
MFIESWSLKRSMNSRAITPELENILHRSLNVGALGGKVLGAGGGGFCMFWVKDGGREEFLNKFGVGVHVPIKISHEGSTCILK